MHLMACSARDEVRVEANPVALPLLASWDMTRLSLYPELQKLTSAYHIEVHRPSSLPNHMRLTDIRYSQIISTM